VTTDLNTRDRARLRVLVTGAGGFVGPYVVAALHAASQTGQREIDILATGRASMNDGTPSFAIQPLDITDAAAVATVVADYQPTHVLHLAAIAAPTRAGADPDLAWRVNLGGSLNIARAMRAVPRREGATSATLVFASSGLVYGDTARTGRALVETDLLAPNGDYAATKAAAELALGSLAGVTAAGTGLQVIRCRPFNHTGPGQTEDYVLPSFAAQIARIERGEQAPVLRVGNLDALRDFLDVRDVADAYVRMILGSSKLGANAIFNIASGIPCSIRQLLDQMLAEARVPIAVEVDPQRWRPNDVPFVVGDAQLLRDTLGWSPRLDMATLVRDLLQSHRAVRQPV
jgi:GDP-4-dehydro-6-deoxy-D-mannose reductase